MSKCCLPLIVLLSLTAGLPAEQPLDTAKLPPVPKGWQGPRNEPGSQVNGACYLWKSEPQIRKGNMVACVGLYVYPDHEYGYRHPRFALSSMARKDPNELLAATRKYEKCDYEITKVRDGDWVWTVCRARDTQHLGPPFPPPMVRVIITNPNQGKWAVLEFAAGSRAFPPNAPGPGWFLAEKRSSLYQILKKQHYRCEVGDENWQATWPTFA